MNALKMQKDDKRRKFIAKINLEEGFSADVFDQIESSSTIV